MVTEKRLIDANEPIAAFKRYAKEHPNATWGAFGIEEVLNACSTVDVAPIVHGRWVLEREPDGKPYCFHCSACDDDFHYIGITVAYDYCPNCGAKMDGE